MTNEKRFPVQGGLTISWEAAERAYKHYAKRFGSYQTLERLAERGGFGLVEFAILYHDIPSFPIMLMPLQRLDERITSALFAGDIRTYKRAKD